MIETKDNTGAQVAEFNNAWKGRGGLGNLVRELKRQKESRVDFVADTRELGLQVIPTETEGRNVKPAHVKLWGHGTSAGEFLPDPVRFNDKALVQLADKMSPKVPVKFLQELISQNPDRAQVLLNGLWQDTPSKKLVRCLDGNVRAWLSDRYRVMDNFDIAFTCLDEAQRKNGQVFEASLSDTRMRIKFMSHSVWDAINITQKGKPQGDWFAGAIGNADLLGKTILGATIRSEMPGGPGTLHPVVTVSNSETGHGGFMVRIGLLLAACYNVATLETVVSEIHLGGRLDSGIYSAEAISKDSEAVMLKARDAVRAAFDSDKFRRMVAKAKQAQEHKIEKASSAVDSVVQANKFSDEHREAILEHFLGEYDQTLFGLAQAVSRVAQDQSDPDVADEFETVAGKLLVNV